LGFKHDPTLSAFGTGIDFLCRDSVSGPARRTPKKKRFTAAGTGRIHIQGIPALAALSDAFHLFTGYSVLCAAFRASDQISWVRLHPVVSPG
jgi:hypothetical protein